MSRRDLPRLVGRELKVVIDVDRETYTDNIIVAGNTINPEMVIVTHYDSVLNGAVDNASGVAVILALMKLFWPKLHGKALFILTGAEELSYERPYWGKGYRDALELYPHAFHAAKRVIVVDSVGFREAGLVRERELIWLAFPVNDDSILNKTLLITSAVNIDDKKYFSFYHSREDTIDKLACNYMKDALNKLIKITKIA